MVVTGVNLPDRGAVGGSSDGGRVGGDRITGGKERKTPGLEQHKRKHNLA